MRNQKDTSSTLRLNWYYVYNVFDVNAEILAAVELFEVPSKTEEIPPDKTIVKIPPDIKPHMISHRIEVVFWGVRDLKKVHMAQITKPKIIVEVAHTSLTSDTLTNAKKHLNFTNPIKMAEADFPEQEEYAPTLTIKMFDSRNFGISVFAGIHIMPMKIFYYKPQTAEERNVKLMDTRRNSLEFDPSIGNYFAFELFLFLVESLIQKIEEVQSCDGICNTRVKKPKTTNVLKKLIKFICFRRVKKPPPQPVVFEEAETEDSSDFDWWTKYYASLEVGT